MTEGIRSPTAHDVGLFGSGSVTWTVHGDPTVMWVGGLRALLLQALHPLTMAGVDQHSNFREDPWGRLQRTGDYLATVTFADTTTAEGAAATVRRVHHGLAGVEPETGRYYRVNDPELLLWVHCCEIDSSLAIALRSRLGLDRRAADRYVDEQRVAAHLMHIPDGRVPRTRNKLADYFATVRTQLRCTRAARDAAGFLLWPPMSLRLNVLTPALPAWSALAGLAAATLPPWARRLYGLPGLPTTDLGATAAVSAAGQLTRLLPARWREHPYHRRALSRVNPAQSSV